MTQNDGKISFTTQCLFDGFISLLREKEFSKISVSEICKRAGVSRSTFYRNYDSKESVITHYFREHAVGLSEGPQDSRSYMRLVYEGLKFCEDHRDELLLLYQQVDEDVISIALLEMVTSLSTRHFNEMNTTLGYDNHLEIAAHMGAFFMLESAWIKGGMKEPSKEVMRAFLKVVNHKNIYDGVRREDSRVDQAAENAADLVKGV